MTMTARVTSPNRVDRTARVVVATAFGGPEVLAVVDEDIGVPGAGEVRIAVRAAGINALDWKRYSGAMGTSARLPMRIGFEAAGVVLDVVGAAVGPAGRVRVGDEVIAFHIDGGYAEEVVVPASAVVPKPAAMGWEAAGGLMLAGTAAVHALTATAVSAEETLLVHAAAGGVGLMAVQVALARGARVIGTASEGNHPYLRKLGAEPTTYGEGLADRVRELVPRGVDAAIDCVGTDEAVDVSLELVANRDRIASIVAFQRGGAVGIKILGGGPGADPGTDVRNRARLQLTALVEQGKLEVRTRSFELAEVAEAHREGQAGHVSGKLVLTPTAYPARPRLSKISGGGKRSTSPRGVGQIRSSLRSSTRPRWVAHRIGGREQRQPPGLTRRTSRRRAGSRRVPARPGTRSGRRFENARCRPLELNCPFALSRGGCDPRLCRVTLVDMADEQDATDREATR